MSGSQISWFAIPLWWDVFGWRCECWLLFWLHSILMITSTPRLAHPLNVLVTSAVTTIRRRFDMWLLHQRQAAHDDDVIVASGASLLAERGSVGVGVSGHGRLYLWWCNGWFDCWVSDKLATTRRIRRCDCISSDGYVTTTIWWLLHQRWWQWYIDDLIVASAASWQRISASAHYVLTMTTTTWLLHQQYEAVTTTADLML